MISLIVAMGENNVIGKDNTMPWHLPNDLRYFKKTTLGNTIVMGRKTFESLGRLLPNRRHVVLTRSEAEFPEEVIVKRTIADIIAYEKEHTNEEIFIIGGGEIYRQMLPFADRLYITEIDEHFTGDVFFPQLNIDEWKLISEHEGTVDEQNKLAHRFLVYDKIK